MQQSARTFVNPPPREGRVTTEGGLFVVLFGGPIAFTISRKGAQLTPFGRGKVAPYNLLKKLGPVV